MGAWRRPSVSATIWIDPLTVGGSATAVHLGPVFTNLVVQQAGLNARNQGLEWIDDDAAG